MEFSVFALPTKPKVGFLSSFIPRQILPFGVPHNRLGRKEGVLPRGGSALGPGSYDIEKKTGLTYELNARPVSSKGYTLGARLGPRLNLENQGHTPAPNLYRKVRDPREVKPARKPFGDTTVRFPDKTKVTFELTPGPGSYDHELVRNRKVQFHQSFGGTPILMPAATKQSSIPRNTDKLSTSSVEQKHNRKLAYLKLYY